MPIESSVIENIIQLGIAGLIIYVILRPIITWFMSRADQKDEQIKELIERHFVHDEERHRIMIAMLDGLPGKITQSITKIYDPIIYKKSDAVYAKLLKEEK